MRIPDFIFQCMPPAFFKNFNGRSLGKCMVDSPTGTHWAVNVAENGNRLYFGSGRHDFVKDHCLGYGNFLVFK